MLVPIANLNPDVACAELYGGKGYGLYRMKQDGIPVPPALVLTTDECLEYLKDPVAYGHKLYGLVDEIEAYFQKTMGYQPLLSVRSGARVSMPGMMDTVLNVGLDDTTLPEWQKKLGSGVAHDCFRRLTEMYCGVVLGATEEDVTAKGSALEWFTSCYGEQWVPRKEQIVECIKAVFRSWNNDRAKLYRKIHKIPDDWGTAVVIQAMVFGNSGKNSGTGVLFTRNPDTGENKVTGEFLINAQGEDVVAGTATPMPLGNMQEWNPAVYDQLIKTVKTLEAKYRDVQDVEFTVDNGTLYLLQTRTAKRSARAAVRIAVDMVAEGLIEPKEAVKRVTARQFDLASQPQIDESKAVSADLKGIPACSGVAHGRVVYTSKQAVSAKGPVILVRMETTPDDLEGMAAAVAIVTATGGSTSHAAVVARAMNKVCVVGVGDGIKELYENKVSMSMTVDGGSGRVWLGTAATTVPLIYPEADGALQKFGEMLVQAQDTIEELKYGEMPLGSRAVIPFAEMAGQSLADCFEWVKAVAEKIGPKNVRITDQYKDAPPTDAVARMFTTLGIVQTSINEEFREKLAKKLGVVVMAPPMIKNVADLLVLAQDAGWDKVYEWDAESATTKENHAYENLMSLVPNLLPQQNTAWPAAKSHARVIGWLG